MELCRVLEVRGPTPPIEDRPCWDLCAVSGPLLAEVTRLGEAAGNGWGWTPPDPRARAGAASRVERLARPSMAVASKEGVSCNITLHCTLY